MSEEYVNMKDIKREERKRKLKEKAMNTLHWMSEHKEETVIIGGVATAVIKGATKIVCSTQKTRKEQQEERRRDLNVYDPSCGCYCELRRPLSNSEKVELAQLRKRGYCVTEALDQMGVLK